MLEITVADIQKMSYTDFVGFINQWNVLPGAYTTLSKWCVFSQLGSSSRILEIACTTGFSSRELSLMSGCHGVAFDISENSVDAAKRNKLLYAPSINVDYCVADGYVFTSEKKFTHIILGAALKFFPQPEKMLKRCIGLLEDGGYILASPFYVEGSMPENLLEKFKNIFGIYPTTESYKEIMQMYRGLEIIYEDRNDLIQETEEELHHYCESTINRVCMEKDIVDDALKSAMYDRLLQIKRMSNELRPYQRYSVLVLRFRKNIYPNRYVELF